MPNDEHFAKMPPPKKGYDIIRELVTARPDRSSEGTGARRRRAKIDSVVDAMQSGIDEANK